ncbi:hypothetical protein AHF37_01778 [Paragonimus kellicotti]|nr:hypothetical protein AHF37_01778 [Paragonimus kellicotti]
MNQICRIAKTHTIKKYIDVEVECCLSPQIIPLLSASDSEPLQRAIRRNQAMTADEFLFTSGEAGHLTEVDSIFEGIYTLSYAAFLGIPKGIFRAWLVHRIDTTVWLDECVVVHQLHLSEPEYRVMTIHNASLGLNTCRFKCPRLFSLGHIGLVTVVLNAYDQVHSVKEEEYMFQKLVLHRFRRHLGLSIDEQIVLARWLQYVNLTEWLASKLKTDYAYKNLNWCNFVQASFICVLRAEHITISVLAYTGEDSPLIRPSTVPLIQAAFRHMVLSWFDHPKNENPSNFWTPMNSLTAYMKLLTGWSASVTRNTTARMHGSAVSVTTSVQRFYPVNQSNPWTAVSDDFTVERSMAQTTESFFLKKSAVQHEDSGLYACNVIGDDVMKHRIGFSPRLFQMYQMCPYSCLTYLTARFCVRGRMHVAVNRPLVMFNILGPGGQGIPHCMHHQNSDDQTVDKVPISLDSHPFYLYLNRTIATFELVNMKARLNDSGTYHCQLKVFQWEVYMFGHFTELLIPSKQSCYAKHTVDFDEETNINIPETIEKAHLYIETSRRGFKLTRFICTFQLDHVAFAALTYQALLKARNTSLEFLNNINLSLRQQIVHFLTNPNSTEAQQLPSETGYAIDVSLQKVKIGWHATIYPNEHWQMLISHKNRAPDGQQSNELSEPKQYTIYHKSLQSKKVRIAYQNVTSFMVYYQPEPAATYEDSGVYFCEVTSCFTGCPVYHLTRPRRLTVLPQPDILSMHFHSRFPVTGGVDEIRNDNFYQINVDKKDPLLPYLQNLYVYCVIRIFPVWSDVYRAKFEVSENLVNRTRTISYSQPNETITMTGFVCQVYVLVGPDPAVHPGPLNASCVVLFNDDAFVDELDLRERKQIRLLMQSRRVFVDPRSRPFIYTEFTESDDEEVMYIIRNWTTQTRYASTVFHASVLGKDRLAEGLFRLSILAYLAKPKARILFGANPDGEIVRMWAACIVKCTSEQAIPLDLHTRGYTIKVTTQQVMEGIEAARPNVFSELVKSNNSLFQMAFNQLTGQTRTAAVFHKESFKKRQHETVSTFTILASLGVG